MNAFWKIKLLLSVSLLVLTGCTSSGSQSSPVSITPSKASAQTELIVSAAASLQDSLKEFAMLYGKTHPEIKLALNFGASGALQQQIEQGAPADLFISAGQKQMDTLIAEQLIAKEQTVQLLANTLVVIVPGESKLQLSAATDFNDPKLRKLALGDAESVPAGTYAKESLSFYKLWDSLLPKLVFAKDVRQVLTYVESGNVDAGIVYLTDALTSKKVKIVFTPDPASYHAIQYPAGVVKAAKHANAAAAFLADLQGKEAADIFNKYGFKKPGE
jgi:molybdate transport system substrate-binding protein